MAKKQIIMQGDFKIGQVFLAITPNFEHTFEHDGTITLTKSR